MCGFRLYEHKDGVMTNDVRLGRCGLRNKVVRLGVFALSFVLGLGVAVGQMQDQGGAPDFAMGPQGRMVRGTVTAAAADHLTVKTEAGETYQVVVTTNTRMMKDRQPVKLADVHAGDGVGVAGVIDQSTKTVHAAVLFVVDAEQIKKARENLGKTYITGKITAIDEANLTILRPDGVSQKITVDEGTSFKKGGRRGMRGDGMGMGLGSGNGALGAGQGSGQASGGSGGQGAGGGDGPGGGGQSITLADVKVGDMVFGQGALKGGVFVPTQLSVADPAAMGRRRDRGDGAGGPPPAAGTEPD
jgi:hypothetical protein